MNDSLNKGETSRLITIKSPNNIHTIAIIDNIIIIILKSKPQKSTQLLLHLLEEISFCGQIHAQGFRKLCNSKF